MRRRKNVWERDCKRRRKNERVIDASCTVIATAVTKPTRRQSTCSDYISSCIHRTAFVVSTFLQFHVLLFRFASFRFVCFRFTDSFHFRFFRFIPQTNQILTHSNPSCYNTQFPHNIKMTEKKINSCEKSHSTDLVCSENGQLWGCVTRPFTRARLIPFLLSFLWLCDWRRW